GGGGARSAQASGASAQRGVAERSASGRKASEAGQAVAEAGQADRVDGLEGHRPDAPADLQTASPAPTLSAAEQRRLAKERRRAVEKATRELARLEARIAEREKALEELAWRLADPAVLRDGERARALDAERAGLRA